MVMRLLLAQGHGRTVIVDVGAGGGHSEKNRQIYAFEDTDHLLDVDAVSNLRDFFGRILNQTVSLARGKLGTPNNPRDLIRNS